MDWFLHSLQVFGERAPDFFKFFASILYEALPFVVLGAAIAGILEELVPQQLIGRILTGLERWVPGGVVRVAAILLGGILGLAFPMCECGIIPVMRRLLGKGLPLSCCTAYLLAGPIINVVVMTSTYAAFSGAGEPAVGAARFSPQMPTLTMVALRVGLGYVVAVLTSLVVEWQWRRHGSKLLLPLAMPGGKGRTDDDGSLWRSRPLLQRLSNISETALHDFVDITLFLMLGALLASGVRTFLSHEDIAALATQNPLLVIVLMMGLAVVLCLCSEADAFVAASFTTLPSAAKLAFLVLGPMLDLKLYFMYTRVFRPRLIWTIITAVVVQVFLYSVITHYVWVDYAAPPPPDQAAAAAAADR
ncbi:MAG TPA: permease [Gemmataceae bacterium]|nr:permease [Gemmataceae bacterium]